MGVVYKVPLLRIPLISGILESGTGVCCRDLNKGYKNDRSDNLTL